jgi:hypothetical protein
VLPESSGSVVDDDSTFVVGSPVGSLEVASLLVASLLVDAGIVETDPAVVVSVMPDGSVVVPSSSSVDGCPPSTKSLHALPSASIETKVIGRSPCTTGGACPSSDREVKPRPACAGYRALVH